MLLAGSFSFIGVGVMASALPLLFPERGSQMTHVFIALILLVSGVYYPVTVLPDVLQKIAVIQPGDLCADRRAQGAAGRDSHVGFVGLYLACINHGCLPDTVGLVGFPPGGNLRQTHRESYTKWIGNSYQKILREGVDLSVQTLGRMRWPNVNRKPCYVDFSG